MAAQPRCSAQPRYHWPDGPAAVALRVVPLRWCRSCSNAAPPLPDEQRGHRHGCCGSTVLPARLCNPEKSCQALVSLRARYPQPCSAMPVVCDWSWNALVGLGLPRSRLDRRSHRAVLPHGSLVGLLSLGTRLWRSRPNSHYPFHRTYLVGSLRARLLGAVLLGRRWSKNRFFACGRLALSALLWGPIVIGIGQLFRGTGQMIGASGLAEFRRCPSNAGAVPERVSRFFFALKYPLHGCTCYSWRNFSRRRAKSPGLTAKRTAQSQTRTRQIPIPVAATAETGYRRQSVFPSKRRSAWNARIWGPPSCPNRTTAEVKRPVNP